MPLGHSLQPKGLKSSAARTYIPNQTCQPNSGNRHNEKEDPIRDWSEETDTSCQPDSLTPGDASWDLTDCRSSWGNVESSAPIESAKRDAEENELSAQPK